MVVLVELSDHHENYTAYKYAHGPDLTVSFIMHRRDVLLCIGKMGSWYGVVKNGILGWVAKDALRPVK